MVEINFTFDELKRIQDWNDLLFGSYNPNRPRQRRLVLRPTDDDLILLEKICWLRLEMLKGILDEEKLRGDD